MFKKLLLAALGGLIIKGNAVAQTQGRYGEGSYNTRQVVQEMEYIEKNVRPLTPKPNRKIFITGSSAGIGQLAAKRLLAQGYTVVVHARNEARAADLKRDLPAAAQVVIGDLGKPDEVDKMAAELNRIGRFDTVVHNAGVYRGEGIFQINLLAPYVLTAKMHKPATLVFVGSNMHNGGDLRLDSFNVASVGYSDSKLQLLTLSKALAARWQDVGVHTMHPGWVGTKMSGGNAPDPLRPAYETLAWLAAGNSGAVSGGYFHNRRPDPDYRKDSEDPAKQVALLRALERVTGVKLPQ